MSQTQLSADTLFHVGSISKSFTALGVLKAVDKGLLALDDPLKSTCHGLPSTVVGARRKLRKLRFAIF
jgi:CubicO group peptidase (beta-lactamase class C family)